MEIVHSSGISTGQLLHKVDAKAKPSNVRWLVTFDDDDRLDEEVPEKSFGRLIQGGELVMAEEASSSTSGGRQRGGKPGSRDGESSGSSDLDNESDAKKLVGSNSRRRAGRRVAKDANETEENTSADGSRGRFSSSEKNPAHVEIGGVGRKRRRGGGETRITTRSRAKRNQESGLPSTDPLDVKEAVDRTFKGKALKGRRVGKRQRAPKTPGEVVTKVEMLTGTLYLYRGENPRAEFIRYF